ncbi:tail fiber domain-containing protein [Flavobacterium sp.]|uniref:tail fiber domain-containing protein n=1 Tax=Flavobacterium sp. TaxID=239 RepID=UPI0025B9AD13|nr:tail fiber domain-containing protein [Flavobacterium sp.]MBA4155294.1 hypothetical protein [Flavobacterium sp.]
MRNIVIHFGLIFCFTNVFAQVGIGTTTPNATLEIKSTDQTAPANSDGILIPKVDAFPTINPTALQDGMMIYLTTLVSSNQPGFYYWENATSTWKNVGGDNGWVLNGNSGTSPISNYIAASNENFVGTSDATDLSIGANNMEFIRLKSGIDKIGFFNNNPDYNLDIQTNITSIILPRNGIRLKDVMLSSGAQKGSFFGFDRNNLNETLIWTYGDDENISYNKSIRFGVGNETTNQTLAKFTYRSIGVFGDNPTYSLDIKTSPNDAVFHTTRRNGIRINTPMSNSSTNYAGLFLGIKENGSFQDANEGYIWNYGDGVTTNPFLSFGLGVDTSTGEIMRMFKDNIGIGTTTPTVGAIVDINSNNSGILIPRINLADVNSNGPIMTVTTSLLLYNTNPFIIGGSGEGFYYWDSVKWVKLMTESDSQWSITGNSGIDSSINFIGTKDNNDVIFKRNLWISGMLGQTNTSFGYAGLTLSGYGQNNSAFGAATLYSNYSGNNNVAVGRQSLLSNYSGNANTAVGANTLQTNQNGSENTAIGYQSLYYNTIGSNNSSLGSGSLYFNDFGSNNTAMGKNSLYSNINGNDNTASGNYSLTSNTSGSNNSAFGTNSLNNNTIGILNTASGYYSLYRNISGNYNSSFGASALYNNFGDFNVAIGISALFYNSYGGYNTATGVNALINNEIGNYNVANGSESLFSSKGSYNTAIGNRALYNNEFGSNNTALGNAADVSISNLTNATAIGANAYVGASNALVLGSISSVNGAINNTDVGIGISTPQDRLHVVGNIRNSVLAGVGTRLTSSDPNGVLTSISEGAIGEILTQTSIGPVWQNAPVNAWGLTGNTGTFHTVNFIGTIDNIDVVFKRNNILSGRISTNTTSFGYNTLNFGNSGNANTAFGTNTLSFNTWGYNNTATGYASLANNTSGNQNTATGTNALYYNSWGTSNTANGSNSLYSNTTGFNNSAFGSQVLYSNTTGSGNTGNGISALYSNTTGSNNIAIGNFALYSNTTGVNNSAHGSQALYSNTTGNANTGIGANALVSNTTGGTNTAVGGASLYYNTTGSGNTASGYYSLFSNTSGFNNTASGYLSLQNNTTGFYNTASGLSALQNNTVGTYNTATGVSALQNNVAGTYNTATGVFALFANTTGSNNTSIGRSALLGNTVGNFNTASGAYALSSNSSGINNTANGYLSLYSNVTGSYNSALGVESLYTNTTGVANTSLGYQSLRANTLGSYNSAMGSGALITNSTGNFNTSSGNGSLYNNTSGSYNSAIGFRGLEYNTIGNFNTSCGVDALRINTTGSNNTAIGYNANVPNGAANNQIRIGDYNITYAGVQVGWSITSDSRWKTNIKPSSLGLEFIKKLNPVSYYRTNDENKKTEYGFVAQEVEKTLDECGDSNNGIITKDDEGLLSMRYNDLIAPLVKAIQEQQKMIEKLNVEIKLLKEKSIAKE